MPSRKSRSSSAQTASKPESQTATGQPSERLDASYLESLIGYNARRAALAVIGVFLERMAPYGLRPVEFSTLSLIHHNPGVTARQLCQTLGLQPPNMVGTIAQFEKRGLLRRRPHPSDGRAQGLHLTPEGQALMQRAELTATELEVEATQRLSPTERARLMALLQKIYL
jgi:DNA-binding MarR family transcriptional regulator